MDLVKSEESEDCEKLCKIFKMHRSCNLETLVSAKSDCEGILQILLERQMEICQYFFYKSFFEFFCFKNKLTFISDSGVSAEYLLSLGFWTDFFMAAKMLLTLLTIPEAADFLFSSFLSSESSLLLSVSSSLGVVSSALSVSLL